MMMMMMGDGSHNNRTVHVPPWRMFDDAAAYTMPVSGVAAGDVSPGGLGETALAALQRYLPSNGYDSEDGSEGADAAVDAYSCDEFRMYEFKVRRCARGRSHDWTECPYAHPGEKARRRDPRKYHYSGTACPDFRKGICKRGDACEFAHGVFECWLHPARYRTQPCKDGTACRRRVCFFAHTPDQLRVLPSTNGSQHSPRSLPESYDGSPLRHHQASLEAYLSKSLFSSSPTSTLLTPPASPPTDSPPMSPRGVAAAIRASPPFGSAVNEVLASLRQLQLCKSESMPTSWGFQMCAGGFGSPRTGGLRAGGFDSLPATPTRTTAVGGGSGWLDHWEATAEEPVERVESGRALRAMMFERLSKEGGLDCSESNGGEAASGAPDVGWVSELVK